ncbi:DUF1217 domain-containing protein [Rhizobium sp. P32RR-XVIII]|uniref:DUF1217 domain-containing protein n=1 Tax=Rhizobium sp. P32RR-XVIII TaxID=2726738 RepID=UPI0014570667|nr:DUF1217 domain-containing protein [Rhizobium sp. P32RR-XVIII]NLS02587.1 DUF1217 domain-containing protein [Rhizobium sp. P32RR-XVIII]
MISTYLSYTILTKNMPSTLDRVAKQPSTQREIDYYNANIGNVKTVDDFMNDYRLYSYATKAYGLADMAYGKGFLKQVLESDLSDPNSFANRLSDPRYKEFAAAFNFGAQPEVAQAPAQEDETLGLYTQSYADEETSARTESTYYSAAVDKVKNVSDLVNNDRLRDYMLQAYDIDPTYVSKTFLKSVLTSDVNDPKSFVNTSANDKYKALAAQFSFNADGTLKNATAQTTAQKNAVIEQYNVTVPSFTTFTAAAYNKTHYEATIGTITSVKQLVSDPRMVDYIKAAFSMWDPPNLSGATVQAIITSDPSDPTSFANVFGYGGVPKMFNFDANGNVPPGEQAQTADQVKKTSENYSENYSQLEQLTVDGGSANFKTRMASVKDIDDFFLSNKDDDDGGINDNDPELYQIVLRAYGLGEDEVTKSQLKKILESDPYDPKSYVNSLKDDRLVKLAKALNFDSKGDASTPLQALSQTQINNFGLAYNTQKTMLLSGAEQQAAVKASKEDIAYFEDNIGKVKSVSDLLADKKLVSFILTAKGLDPKQVTTDTLKKAFAADPDDPKSMLNDPTDKNSAKLKELVTSFNFDSKGNLTRSTTGTAQNGGALRRTNELYLEQALEEQQGDTNQGVRLALYAQRKAPDITSIYDIMGDQAMFEVVTTAFNLPSAFQSMDVDQQAKALQKYVTLSDLQDPDKVDKLVKRFAVMYDLKNNTQSSPALTILTSR